MISYDKLVRDKIPQIIEASGKSCDIEIVNNAQVLVDISSVLWYDDYVGAAISCPFSCSGICGIL